MPESVKAEILAEGAQRAIHTTYKNLRVAFAALILAVVALTLGNVIGWSYVYRSDKQSCIERQEGRNNIKQVFNAVFDEIEKANPEADRSLDGLQLRVEQELPDVDC